MTRDYDVIVVGAGPAGAMTAGLLARAGVRVALLDKAAFPRDKACGEYTSPQAEPLLARTDALPWVEQARPRRLPAMRVIAPHGATFNMDYAAEGGTVLATPRLRLDAALVEYAVAGGAVLRERARVMDILRDGQLVVGVRVRQGAAESELRAPLVVGADGCHSAVARALGLARPQRWPRSLGMVAHYTGVRGCEAWGEMHVAGHGYCGLAPLADGQVNVGIVVALPGPDDRRLSSEARFEAALQAFPSLRETMSGAQRITPVRGSGPVGVGARRPCGPGFVLIGDAAGFFDPFTGEGVYKALRGAELAVPVLLAALARGDFSGQALAPYRAARRRAFFAKDVVCRLVQAFVQVPTGLDYVAPRLARRPEQLRVMAGVLGDLTDARCALTPGYLWGLLRP
ncbi:MAG TPA: NAD(P)/FAD-dependent oxidoreductase [Chloroflexia bacterium]|nr:NAD(P)/FAD-dependent oxidoreductase [Chloroflexia bacterium]